MIVDAGSGRAVASSVEVATTRRARRRGLLGRDRLDAGCAFVLAPCWTVHTVGMRFPIDVVFVDSDGLVLRIVEHMAGWRAAAEWSAAIAIELWAGAVQAVDIHVGDRLCFAPAFVSREPEGVPAQMSREAEAHDPVVPTTPQSSIFNHQSSMR